MLKLLKRIKKREVIMTTFCAAFLLLQIYFDLKLPEFMSELTVLIQTPGSPMSAIWTNGIYMLLCTLASAVLCIVCGYLAARIASGFTYTVRDELFNHVSGLGQEEMLGFSVPSLITRTTNDITQIQMFIAMGLQAIIKAPVMAIWAVIKILGKSWELSLVTASFVVALCIIVVVIVSSVVKRFRIVQKLIDGLNRIARENLTGINVVHAFNAKDYQYDKFDDTNTKMKNIQIKNQRAFSILQPMMMLGMNGLSLAIFWVGAALLSNIPSADSGARLTMFSEVVVFSTYATYVVMAFMMLVMIFMMLPAAEVSAERINEVLDTRANIVEGNVEKGKGNGEIEFKNVTFRYPSAADDDLTDVSFKVNKGQTLAIIGATGSGKTTLVSLIARFYDATSGQVLVDGVNVKDYTFDALYNKLGYITQKAVLFNRSVKDNICFGESLNKIEQNDIDSAVQLAQAKEFVDNLDDGIDYKIAQGGANVSGGQKQRLSIARALARKPEILVFDDSFSALDYHTDALLREGLNKNLKDTTKIIVAQRISTIRHADKILVLDEGRIVGKGTHDELMKSCDVYKEIALSQLSQEELN